MLRTRRLQSALILLVAPVLLMACGASSPASGQPGTTVRSPATNTVPPATPTPVPHFTIGDQVQIGDTWTVTVTDATISSGDSISTPQPGNKYLILDVTQQNRSSQAASIHGAVDWVLNDSMGRPYLLTATDYGEPPNGDVQAGDAQEGQLVYEVPTLEHTFTLAFAPGGGSVQAIWDIQV